MKTATVPAQVTTVEDKIAGNLTLQQAALLGGPVFLDFAIYMVLPSMFRLNAYKLVLMAIITSTADVLAIRVRGKILLVWAITMFRYNSRPRYYVFNKNNSHLRTELSRPNIKTPAPIISHTKKADQRSSQQLSEEDIFKLESALVEQLASIRFATSKKGGLYVSIPEVE
jgi:hypothetical protein